MEPNVNIVHNRFDFLLFLHEKLSNIEHHSLCNVKQQSTEKSLLYCKLRYNDGNKNK